MTSVTVAWGGAGWVRESAMICSSGDPITLSGIRSHRPARAGARWLGIGRGARGDVAAVTPSPAREVSGQDVWPAGSAAPGTPRDMRGMISDDTADGHAESLGQQR